MNELVAIITSAEMPDHDYPVFRLLETEEIILPEFSCRGINIGAAGINEDDVVFEAALLFTIRVIDSNKEYLVTAKNGNIKVLRETEYECHK